MPDDDAVRWHVYIRWPTGRRATIVADSPTPQLPEHAWQMASMPVPRVVSYQGEMPPRATLPA